MHSGEWCSIPPISIQFISELKPQTCISALLMSMSLFSFAKKDKNTIKILL